MPDFDGRPAPIPDRALIVDDDPEICSVLSNLLQHAGWDVVVAMHFAEAKAVIEDKTRPLGLTIIDLRLPDGDGMDLVPMVQARRDRPDVVITTGFASEPAYLRAIRLGVLDFLNKPFLASNVGEMLRNRSVRERQRLGILVDRFERVDEEIASIHKALRDIRASLKTWEAAQEQASRRTAT